MIAVLVMQLVQQLVQRLAKEQVQHQRLRMLVQTAPCRLLWVPLLALLLLL